MTERNTIQWAFIRNSEGEWGIWIPGGAKKGDTVTLPKKIAEILIRKGIAEKQEGLK